MNTNPILPINIVEEFKFPFFLVIKNPAINDFHLNCLEDEFCYNVDIRPYCLNTIQYRGSFNINKYLKQVFKTSF